jgi:hypothetical protein
LFSSKPVSSLLFHILIISNLYYFTKFIIHF